MARTLLLARLLSPTDFGLFGIALLVLGTFESFSLTGFQQALVQRKGDIRPYLDTAWSFSVIRGIALASIVFSLGPFVGRFFHEPGAVILFQAAALCLLLRGFTNIGIVYFVKNLTFNRQFVFMLSGTLTDLMISAVSAIALRNAWALLLGYVAGNFMRVIVSFIVEPYRPRFTVDLKKAREMAVFGRWVFLGGILTFLLNHGDDLTVGKLLDSTNLGLYRMAYLISSLPTSEFAQALSEIIFSAFSRLQDRTAALRAAYLDAMHTVALVTFPMTAGIIFVARDLTLVVLGQPWLPMVPTMLALSVWGFTRSITATTGALFQSVGRPGIGAKLQLARLALFAILVFPFTLAGGILGTGLAVTISGFAFEPFAVYLSLKLIECGYAKFVRLLVPPTFATGAMWIGLTVAEAFLRAEPPSLRLGVLIATGIFIYFAALSAFDRCLGSEVRLLLRRRYSQLAQRPRFTLFDHAR